MLPQERVATASMSAVYAFRMLGLFMVLPVLSLHVTDIEQATPFLIGTALGAYGLTQALLQIPFGMLSDRFGRKPVIFTGLCLLILGSLIAAFAPNVYWLILGRALQGAGAVGAVLLALLSDLTRDAVRTKAMAAVGISIGAAFSLAMLVGPIIDAAFGLRAIFLLSAVLGAAGIVMVSKGVKAPPLSQQSSERATTGILTILKDKVLLRLSLSIACLHATLTILFLQLPWQIRGYFDEGSVNLWQLYLPVMFIAVLFLRPLLKTTQQIERSPQVMRLAIVGLVVAELFIGLGSRLWVLLLGMLVFFTLFNLLEAMLPSLVSRLVPPQSKGAALGIYSTSQFFGVFLGGTIGGLLFQHYEGMGVLAGCIACALLWQLGLTGWKISPNISRG